MMRFVLNIAEQCLHAVESLEGYGADEWLDLGDAGSIDPSFAVYDAPTGVVVEDLAAVRSLCAIAATAYRDHRIAAGCATSLGAVDADDVSRTNILGAVSMALIAKQASQPFSIEWRMHDNSYVTLDADQTIQMGVEVGAFVNACYQASFSAKNAIDAATSAATIRAVDVTAGYPA